MNSTMTRGTILKRDGTRFAGPVGCVQINQAFKVPPLRTSWKSNCEFGAWIVSRVRAKTVVDLGVDWGYSSFAFALPRGLGHTVFAVDIFLKEQCTQDATVLRAAARLGLNATVEVVPRLFHVARETFDAPVDVLHVDGTHRLPDVARGVRFTRGMRCPSAPAQVRYDYDEWSSLVPRTGVVLFHDVDANPGKSLFLSLDGFKYVLGEWQLGVLTQDGDLYADVARRWPGTPLERRVVPLDPAKFKLDGARMQGSVQHTCRNPAKQGH